MPFHPAAWRRACLVLLALALLPSARAGCSRPMQVPVAPMGITITIDGANVGGIFPDMLRSAGSAAGCEFVWSVAPRARIEAQFEAGQTDLLLAASQTARRDQAGVFVPMVSVRATLISVDAKRAPVRSFAELLNRRELRVALVRGYDFGEPYRQLQQKLGEQNRLILESNSAKVARLVNEGVADVTIMTPIGMAGSIHSDERLKGMLERLRIEPVDELPWTDTGVYISTSTVSADDRAVLEKIILSLGKKKTLWEAYRRFYPASIIAESIRIP